MSDPGPTAAEGQEWVEQAREDLDDIQHEIDDARREFEAEHPHVETFIEGAEGEDDDS
jgi:hypothetical protein